MSCVWGRSCSVSLFKTFIFVWQSIGKMLFGPMGYFYAVLRGATGKNGHILPVWYPILIIHQRRSFTSQNRPSKQNKLWLHSERFISSLIQNNWSFCRMWFSVNYHVPPESQHQSSSRSRWTSPIIKGSHSFSPRVLRVIYFSKLCLSSCYLNKEHTFVFFHRDSTEEPVIVTLFDQFVLHKYKFQISWLLGQGQVVKLKFLKYSGLFLVSHACNKNYNWAWSRSEVTSLTSLPTGTFEPDIVKYIFFHTAAVHCLFSLLDAALCGLSRWSEDHADTATFRFTVWFRKSYIFLKVIALTQPLSDWLLRLNIRAINGKASSTFPKFS